MGISSLALFGWSKRPREAAEPKSHKRAHLSCLHYGVTTTVPPLHMEAGSVPHYEILDEIGRGGMGVVYRARDRRLGRIVALKFLPDYLSTDPEAKARFIHEGRAASSLDHSAICTIYEIGEVADGQMYMAMAFIEGQPLADVIEQGPLPLERALRISIQIADGLRHSHEQGVTHRDMKPGNVIVNAAYLAAADGGVGTMDHILHGTRRELQKMGRLLNAEDLRIEKTTVST